MSTVNIMALNLVLLFGYYTFINNQISIQRLQASKLKEEIESIGGIEFFTCSLTKQVILLIIWLSSQPDRTHFKVLSLSGCVRIGRLTHN